MQENDMSQEHNEQEDSGTHSIPIARIKNLIFTVSDVLAPSPDGLFAFAKACELFIDELVRGIHSQYGNNIDYDEVASFISENEDLCFLHEFFPRSMTFEAAVQKVKEKNSE